MMDSDSDTAFTEKSHLIHGNSLKRNKSYSRSGDYRLLEGDENEKKNKPLALKKHITLIHAIGLMVGTVAGSGIFISPTGVTQELGSVGATLIMWAVTGLFNLLLALCYAELGTALPLAGGDYAYIDYVMGKFPAFLVLWLMVVLIAPCALAVSAKTVSTYFATSLGMECYLSLSILVPIWVVVTVAVVNCASALWSSRMITLFSLGKIIAMGVIVVVGIVNITNGYTRNFDAPFAYGTSDPGRIMLSFLPAFFTFAGWDCVNALAEEMVNPKRDLPIATVVSILLVTGVYIMMNVAYFTVITPLEFVQSSAVATLFAQRTMPSASFLLPVFVIVSAFGTTLNIMLACPRWGFAGGRNKALPTIFSHIHIKTLLPVPSILFTTILAVLFCLTVFFDLQDLLNITSIIAQMKIVIALIALLILKKREPEKESTITVPFIVVLLASLVLAALTLLPLWQTPVVAGTAYGVFLLGIPLYFVKEYVGSWDCMKRGMNSMTETLQLLLQVVPSTKTD